MKSLGKIKAAIFCNLQVYSALQVIE